MTLTISINDPLKDSLTPQYLKKLVEYFYVSYSDEKKAYADILFNGVLTNLYYNGKRFYDPFIPSAISLPEWEKRTTNITNFKNS